MGFRAVVLLAAASAVVAAAGAVLTLPGPPASVPQPVVAVAVRVPAVDTGDRAAVTRLWNDLLAPALAVRPRWTGSASACRPGALAPAAQTATLTAVNAARRLAGLDPVRFDPALSAKAQQAALVFTAQRDLSHDIPSTWACATAGAQQAASLSDIALSTDAGGSGANAVVAYLNEPGTSTSVVSALHRRLLLDPGVAVMGSGSTGTANALWVRGPRAAHPTVPAWMPWPSAGWFPAGLEPSGRWSLSAPGADFHFAHVEVRSATGVVLPVSSVETRADAGLPALIWHVDGVLPPAAGHPRSYTVSVSGIRSGGRTVTHRWTVHLFDPTALVPGTATITAHHGLLTVHPAAFTPAATTTAVQWTRDGLPVPGAIGPTYRRPAGAARIGVVVTGERSGWTAATETATAPR